MAPVSALAKYKLVFLGDQLVGKTSIITRFMYNKFDGRYQATIGIDFISKTINLGDQTVRLQIWDTAGQERFRSIIPSYIRDSSVAVIVFGVASRQSFLNTSKWIEDVRTERGTDVIIVLVGNKADLVDKREVSIEEGEAKAQELDVMFMETSAKTDFDIKIADELPGMQNISSANQDVTVDAKLKSSSENPEQSQSQGIPLSATKIKNMQKQATTRIAMAPVSALAKYKLVFLGDQLVGKTSIITRFMYNKFDGRYEATIGIDLISKTINLGDQTVRLQIWDTAGQERFRSLIPSYIRDSSVAVIVFDVASRQSFLNTSKLIEDVRTERGTDVIIVLVGNKVDLVDKREVSIEEGEAKAHDLDVMFMETSAKADFDVKALFLKIADGLPGTENISSSKQDDTVDAKLKSASENPDQSQSQGSS